MSDRSSCEKCSNSPTYHVGKPDVDNLANAVMDALTALGAWGDDAQIYWLIVTKGYAPPGSSTGCLVVIEARSAAKQEKEVRNVHA